ncbi:MAG: hypothetical protein GY807_09425 [Gammaproteobacteria bacterium]|nr:hypothetical protein [Gammaproteobacteria bacterium]
MLFDQAVQATESIEGCELVDHQPMLKLCSLLAEKYGFTINHGRWWTNGKADNYLTETSDLDWRTFYIELQNSIEESEIYFAISNDNVPRDWILIKLRTSSFAELYDSFDRDFEYVLFPKTLGWCLIESNEGVIALYGDYDPKNVPGFKIANH